MQYSKANELSILIHHSEEEYSRQKNIPILA